MPQIIGLFRAIEYEQGITTVQCPLGCQGRRRQRLFSKEASNLFQRHRCFRLPIETVVDEPIWEGTWYRVRGKEVPEDFRNHPGLAHATRATKRHDPSRFEMIEQPFLLLFPIGKVLSTKGALERRSAL